MAGEAEECGGTKRSSLVLISSDPAQTFKIGQILGDGLKGGDCIALNGELGSGKTCLTQGIASGLGVSNRYAVTSPTFTLVNEYPGNKANLIHMDAYRLNGSAELPEMGYDEYLRGSSVMVIEWAEKLKEDLPADALCVKCAYISEKKRRIEICGDPERMVVWEKTLKEGGCG